MKLAPYWGRAAEAEAERRAELAELEAIPEALPEHVVAARSAVPVDPARELRERHEAVALGPYGRWMRGEDGTGPARLRAAQERGEIGPPLPGRAARPGPRFREVWRGGDRYQLDTATKKLELHAAHVPRSTRQCLAGSLWLSYHAEAGAAATTIQLGCDSWRCPKCGPRVNRRDFVRIKGALEELPPGSVFVTLTFDRARWEGPFEAACAASRCWQTYRQAIQYRLGERNPGKADASGRLELPYVMVFEQHTKADDRGYWLHAHLLISSPELAEWLREEGHQDEYNVLKDRNERRYRLAEKGGALGQLALRSGFGRVDFKPLAGRQGMAEYLTKISYMAGEMTGSRAKSQYPTHAPPRFRRIRSSRGFLPRVREVVPEAEKKLAAVMVAPPRLVAHLMETGGGRLKQSAKALAQAVKRAMVAPLVAAEALARSEARGDPVPLEPVGETLPEHDAHRVYEWCRITPLPGEPSIGPLQPMPY